MSPTASGTAIAVTVLLEDVAMTRTDAMNPPKNDVADDDPTDEEPVLEFDGTATDQLDSSYRMKVVSTSENGSGSVDSDERGQSRWKWVTESPSASKPAKTPATPTEETFDYLKALTNDGLELADENAGAELPESGKVVGYDPYDTARNDPPTQGSSKKPELS